MSWLGFAVLAWCGLALADGFYLESPGFPTRAEAVSIQQLATADGLSARVVRRFETGAGWAYLVRVDGFSEGAAATEAAQRLADQSGRRVTVHAADGEVALGRVEPGATVPTQTAVAVTEAMPRSPAATQVVAGTPAADGASELRSGLAAAAAHPDLLVAVSAAETVIFEFRRKTPDGLVVHHTWASRGADRHLATRVEAGTGTDSRMWVADGKGALVVGNAAPTSADPVRALELIERMSPTQVLGAGLGLRAAAPSREAPQVAGLTTVDGASCAVLRVGDATGGAPNLVALDGRLGLVREVAFGGPDPVLQSFEGYGQVDGQPRLPRSVRVVTEDGWLDDVEILRLDLDSPPPDAWFRP